MGKLFLLIFCFYFLFTSCERKSNAFKNKIEPVISEIIPDTYDVSVLKTLKIVRCYYYKVKNDSGLILRNLDLSCWKLKSTMLNQFIAKQSVKGLSSDADIYQFNNSIFSYNTVNYCLENLFVKGISDSPLYSLKNHYSYLQIIPFSAKLVRENKRFHLLYNYEEKSSKKINALDSSIFLYITSSKQVKKIGKYPKSFHTEKLRFTETYFDVDSMSNIYYVHASYDSVFKIDINGVTQNRGIIHEVVDRSPYKQKEIGDLVYVRKYEHESEKNISLKIIQNKYIVILKKLAEKNLMKDPLYKYFIYDTELNKVCADTIKQNIIPNLFETKNGFFVISKNVDKFFSYELP
jgi:hypothetical protein